MSLKYLPHFSKESFTVYNVGMLRDPVPAEFTKRKNTYECS